MINNGWVYSAYCLSSVFDCSLSDMILSSGQRLMITNGVYNSYCLSSVLIVLSGNKKWGETQVSVSCFSLHFFRALAASCVLYNRTEHSESLSIC